MESKNRTLSESEVKRIFTTEEKYAQVKTSISENIDAYISRFGDNPTRTQKLIKKHSELQLEISYCDEKYIIDGSKIQKFDDELYACVKAFKQVHGMNVDPDSPKFKQIGSCLYSDGCYIYDLEDGKLIFSGIEFVVGLYNFILEILSHNFD